MRHEATIGALQMVLVRVGPTRREIKEWTGVALLGKCNERLASDAGRLNALKAGEPVQAQGRSS